MPATTARRITPADLYAAQHARDALTRNIGDLRPFDQLPATEQDKWRSAAVSCRPTRLEPWLGDHTDLHHTLRRAHRDGGDDPATTVLTSTWMDARRAHDQVAILDALTAALAGGDDPATVIAHFRATLIGE